MATRRTCSIRRRRSTSLIRRSSRHRRRRPTRRHLFLSSSRSRPLRRAFRTIRSTSGRNPWPDLSRRSSRHQRHLRIIRRVRPFRPSRNCLLRRSVRPSDPARLTTIRTRSPSRAVRSRNDRQRVAVRPNPRTKGRSRCTAAIYLSTANLHEHANHLGHLMDLGYKAFIYELNALIIYCNISEADV